MNELHEQAELAIRCQLGEPQAWEELVRLWQPKLWRFILHMLSDPLIAEEVLQNVWLRVVRSLVRLREPEKLNAWMYSVARGAVADRLRKNYRQLPTEVFNELPQLNDDIKQLDLSEELADGLTKLNPIDREVVVLHYLEVHLSPTELDEGLENLPFGVHEDSNYPGRTIKTATGDMFLMYSDAFIESVNAQDQFLGICGVLKLLNEIDQPNPAEIIPFLREKIGGMATGNLLDDDASLILGHFTSTAVRLSDNLRAPFRLLGDVQDKTQIG